MPSLSRQLSHAQRQGLKGAAEEERINEMLRTGVALAQAPRPRGAKPPPPKGGGGGAKKKKVAAAAGADDDDEEASTVDGGEEYEVEVGMHIAFDTSRAGRGPCPDDRQPIVTAFPPAASNVAEVSAVHAGGTCDGRLVSPCVPSYPKCCATAGKLVSGLLPAQRQIVCSACYVVNQPHYRPTLRCSACERLVAPATSYYRAPPIGDATADTCLCRACHDDLKAGGGKVRCSCALRVTSIHDHARSCALRVTSIHAHARSCKLKHAHAHAR